MFEYHIIVECYRDICRILNREVDIVVQDEDYMIILVEHSECNRVDKYLNENKT